MSIPVLHDRPAGYIYLLELFGLSGIPNWHQSWVSNRNTHNVTVHDDFVNEIYRAQYWPGDGVREHLEFALKYDGTNLALLAQIFEVISQEDLAHYISFKPNGKYARKIWFFYEFITGKTLPVTDLSSGNYINALDDKKYFTIAKGEKSPRHRIINNLLGPPSFCPIVRKTKKLSSMDVAALRARCVSIISDYPSGLMRRALTYLYNKETKSSFAIEHITPNQSRIERFVDSLQLAQREDFCNKQKLIALQNRIVDPRFAEKDYRKIQNYIGQTVAFQNEIIHYISVKPEDLSPIMEGLIDSHTLMKNNNMTAIIHAAIISYGFVFLHPFEDGNGRIHRFLIHNILSLKELVPHELMFPVSAVMLKNRRDYDASLESFSRPLLQCIDYSLDEMGRMTVKQNTKVWYRYIDFTVQTEALYEFVKKTIEDELVEELNFLASYDRSKLAIQDIIDMPDRLIDLFIQVVLQNNGKLSERKRATFFNFLSDDELAALEQVMKDSR